MRKAVITTGGKQYVVAEGDQIEVELLKDAKKSMSFVPLLLIDGDKTVIGTPEITGGKVTAEVVEKDIKTEKVTSIRFKAKKRVHTKRGHRQRKTVVKIKKIETK